MKNKKTIITSIVVLLIALVGFGAYNYFVKAGVQKGEKNITVIVEDSRNDYKEELKHNTDAEMLGQALDEMGIIKTEDSSFGRIVMGVNNIDADMDKTEWWKFTINDVDSVTGVDGTPVKDGDVIKFIFTIGW